MTTPTGTPPGGTPSFPQRNPNPSETKDEISLDGGASQEKETYAIPGGLSGWSPREIVTAAPGVKRSASRDEDDFEPALRPRRHPPKTGQFWALFGFNALVFLSSVCVMTLEMTASRLIAKHVGSSLYTWTSVIGVVLAGITIGNFIGGWLADRFDRPRTLSWMFLLASLTCAAVLWLDLGMARMSRPENFSWPMWILCVVSAIFLIPSIALGTTSPIIASMALERSAATGRTVGNVYAWGALGSIIGTFLTGYYLVDELGTRAIVGLTAGVLAVLAIIVASRRWVFRTAVMCGWLQILAGLLVVSSVTSTLGAELGSRWGTLRSWMELAETRESLQVSWKTFGKDVATKLHELGLLLNLRDDRPGEYVDESAYSYIHVGDDYIDGNAVKYLRLDKLVHSYYDPAQPTALHYEYEQVYAAVTKAATIANHRDHWLMIPDVPDLDVLIASLPDGTRYEAAQRRLWLDRITPDVLQHLHQQSPDAPYWDAIKYLERETNQPLWGGFASATLAALPEGVTIPASVAQSIRFDSTLEVLTSYAKITPEIRDQLRSASPWSRWHAALEELENRSTRISTLFIGGGGFIFPRWVLAEYPGAERIDVAELDPAVHRVVRQELGLTGRDDERIQATSGDARNFVEDRVQENLRRKQRGEPPILYDFIYGDAFNDFSIPFHLTTVEFAEKQRALLKDQGVLQANVIDIYPRVEIPGSSQLDFEVSLSGRIPKEVCVAGTEESQVPKLKPQALPLLLESKTDGKLVLKTRSAISLKREQTLRALAANDEPWELAVSELAAKSRTKPSLPIPLPDALKPTGEPERKWVRVGATFPGVEVYRLGQSDYVLGLRGEASRELTDKLKALVPNDSQWARLIDDGARRTTQYQGGRFLGRYAKTLATVFPCLYVFSTSADEPTDTRDTYVIVCSLQPLDLNNLSATGYWTNRPFASLVRRDLQDSGTFDGQMETLLSLADGLVLEDDFAPVDNLLRPVFTTQD